MKGTPPLIAIVDDEDSICRALERLLRSASMKVATFTSGAAFLGAFATLPIDCVVLDLHMSGVNGFEVQEHLHEVGTAIPVIVMTGHDTPHSRARALANGAVAYLLKPIEEQVLLAAIAAAVASGN